MKKFLSILLAAMMLFAMVGTAFAADDYVVGSTTNVSNLSSHTFVAYQIFTGKLTVNEEDGTTVLSDVQWSTNLKDGYAQAILDKFPGWDWKTVEGSDAKDTSAGAVAELLTANPADAQAFALLMKDYVESGKTLEPATDAEGNTTVTLDTGYYLIVDETETDDKDYAYNASLLQIAGDGTIEIKVKTDKPNHYKKVQENEKQVTAASMNFVGADGKSNYNDVADYNIGDTVPFTLYSKLPDTTYFRAYEMVFTDVMSKGLTFADDVVVIIDGNETTKFTKTVTTANDETTIVITLDVLAAIKEIEDKLNADLAEGAAPKKLQAGTEIKVGLSAILNEKAVIGLDGNPNTSSMAYSNNPDDTTSKGETTTDTVLVFTYELDVTKVNAKAEKLPGAKFKLYRYNGSTKEYVTVNADGIVTGWNAVGSDLVSAETTGLFVVKGLDDGIYYLDETEAPAGGYNSLEKDIKIEIIGGTVHDAAYDPANGAESALTTLTYKIDDGEEKNGNAETGIVATEVLNNKGATLPETGGIGTTLFYLFGSIMAAGSALILVVRRRAEAEEE